MFLFSTRQATKLKFRRESGAPEGEGRGAQVTSDGWRSLTHQVERGPMVRERGGARCVINDVRAQGARGEKRAQCREDGSKFRDRSLQEGAQICRAAEQRHASTQPATSPPSSPTSCSYMSEVSATVLSCILPCGIALVFQSCWPLMSISCGANY